MPSSAFLKAAKRGNRRPVVALAVESPASYQDAISTQEDWKSGSDIVNLNLDTVPGHVFLKTDSPDPYAIAHANPGLIETWLSSQPTYYNESDWTTNAVGQTRTYTIDVWTPWTPTSDPYCGDFTINIAPHLFDGLLSSLLPVVTAQFVFDIWGMLNGAPPTLLASGQTINDSSTVQSYTLNTNWPTGSWSFALHIRQKTSQVSSTVSGYSGVIPDTVYDNAGSSYLEIRSYTCSYRVPGCKTTPTPFDPNSWIVDNVFVPTQSLACDNWSPWSIPTQSRTTAATLTLVPQMIDGPVGGFIDPDGVQQYAGWIATTSFTFEVWGKLNGGDPQLLVPLAVVTDAAVFQTVQLTGLTRGSWTFALHITGKISSSGVVMPSGDLGLIYQDPTSSSYITLYAFTTDQQSNYLPSGSLTTRVLDLGLVPDTPPVFQMKNGPSVTGDDPIGIPAGSSLVVSAWGSNTDNGSDWENLGDILDGQSIAPFRYYYLHAEFAASPDGLGSPCLSELRITSGTFEYFSTLKDAPVKGAKPYIVEGSLESLSCSIELMDCGKIGEISPKLFWTRETSDMLATGYLKNKRVLCLIGFPELALEDYEPYFGGSWYDYTADHEQRQITVQTRDIWNQFKNEVPPGDQDGASYWTDQYGQKISGKTYPLEGNIIDVMLQVSSVAGIADRDIDKPSFLALKSASFPDADWYVKRELTSSQQADKLMADLAIAAGIFLLPAPTGKLTPIHYDTVIAGPPAATLDALKIHFKPLTGNQKDLFTRQCINYQILSGKEGGSDSDFASQYLVVNEQAEIDWGESPAHTKKWNDVWGVGYNPTTGKVTDGGALVRLAQRMDSWYANPLMTVQATGIPLRHVRVYPGSLIAVNNLRLPAPTANWPGFVTGKNFLLMQRSLDPNTLELSWNLMEIGPTTYIAGNLPSYTLFDRYPAVLNLRANECVVQRATGAVEHLIILQFNRPTDYIFGSAEVWMRTNGGDWAFLATAAFSAGVSSWIEAPCVVGWQYDFAVITINNAGLKQQLALAPQTSITTAGVSTIAYLPPAQNGGAGTGGSGDTSLPGVVVTPPATSGFPPVNGLQLAGQGNDNAFVGRDAKFTWNRYSFSYQLGAADGGAGGPVDGALTGYKITVRNASGTIRRTLTVATEEYTYTYEQNNLDGNGAATRSFSVEVIALGIAGNSQPVFLTVINPAPPAIASMTLVPFIRSFTVDIVPVDVPDLAGYLIYASQTTGYTPGPGTLINQGPDTHILKTAVPGTWYVRVAAYDVYGTDALVFSPEYAVNVLDGAITAADLASELRVDFLVQDSIFYFGDDGAHPTAGTETTLYWTDGSIIRGGTSFTLAGGNMINASNSWIIATLAAGFVTLSLVGCGSGAPEMADNQVVIGYTSPTPNSAGNYLAYIRQANSQQMEGASIREATIGDAQINNLSADKITAGTITGSTLQTAATGKRFTVSTTDNTIKMFTDDGHQPVQIGYTSPSRPSLLGGYLLSLDASDPSWGFTAGLISAVSRGFAVNASAYGSAGVGVSGTSTYQGVGVQGDASGGGNYGGRFLAGAKGAIKIEPSAAPTSPERGAIYYDDTTDHFFGYTATGWKQLDN